MKLVSVTVPWLVFCLIWNGDVAKSSSMLSQDKTVNETPLDWKRLVQLIDRLNVDIETANKSLKNFSNRLDEQEKDTKDSIEADKRMAEDINRLNKALQKYSTLIRRRNGSEPLPKRKLTFDVDDRIIPYFDGVEGKSINETSTDWKRLVQLIDRLNVDIESANKSLKNFSNRLDEQEKGTKESSEADKRMAEDITRLNKTLQKYSTLIRRRHGLRPLPNRKLTFDVDDRIILYFDGVKVKKFQHSIEWRTGGIASLPIGTSVIAIQGINTFGDPGFLASTEDGFILTNSSWKCTNTRINGWQTKDYNDWRWPPASAVQTYAQKPIPGIRSDSAWIWTRPNIKPKDGRFAYCRLNLLPEKDE